MSSLEHQDAVSGLKIVAIAAASYPLAVLGSLYATWVTAWVHLGHMPRVSLDDPKYINWTVDIPYYLTQLLLMSLPVGLIASLVLVPSVLAPKQLTAARTLASWVLSLSLLTAIWGACYWLLRADPWDVATWFID